MNPTARTRYLLDCPRDMSRLEKKIKLAAGRSLEDHYCR